MTTIEAVNVTKTFKLRANGKHKNAVPEEFVALDGINLSIHDGEFIVLLGPSGCGKSTFLDLVSGLSRPNSGTILIDGKPIEGPGLDRGVVFQQYALFPWKTALGNVEFGMEAQKLEKEKRLEIAKKFLSLVGLMGFEDRYPYELSGGMKQRVAIARALAINPEILLMDEPFAALDAQTRELLQIDLLRIRDETKKTIVFITHSIDEAVFLADRVVVMTARPGVVKQIVTIPIPREKRFADDVKSTPEFIQARQLIWDLLKEEVVKSQEICSKCSVDDCSLANVKSAETLITPISGIIAPIEVKSK